MSKNDKRRARRNRAAERRALQRAKKTDNFTLKAELNELKKKRNADLTRRKEKAKTRYERKLERMRTFAQSLDNKEISTAIRELWDMGIKIKPDEYYKDFIDEHENEINVMDIKSIIEGKIAKAEANLSWFDEEDTDPLGLFS